MHNIPQHLLLHKWKQLPLNQTVRHVPLIYIAANIIWNATQVGRTIERLCSQADTQLMGFWSMVQRTCNTGGVWGDPDFSKCTLPQGTNASLLVWFVVQSDSVVTVNNRRQQLEEEVSYLPFYDFSLT